MTPPLSRLARRKKEAFFLAQLPPAGNILEIGPGDGWVREFADRSGWTGYRSIDVVAGVADVVGDIGDLGSLPFSPQQFDAICAFEVIEHVDLLPACRYLLRQGGRLVLTTPVPQMDWALKILEAFRLSQRRTSPHCNLLDVRHLAGFRTLDYRVVAGMSQWGIYERV